MNDDMEGDLITMLAHVFKDTNVEIIRCDEDGMQTLDLAAIAAADKPLDPSPNAPDSLNRIYPDWRLVDPASNQILKVGEVLRDMGDNEYTLVGGRPPHNINSTGRVYVEDGDGTREYFPSVFNLKWEYVGVDDES